MTFQTFTPRQYLQIDIANNFGREKDDWDVRLDWFEKNEAHLELLLNQAEEPALYYAAVKAWRNVQRGEPIGYMISLDATSSGLQILAALTGDRSAAELCNLVDVGYRADAYTEVHQAMVYQTGEGANIKRDMSKQAVMTSLYGSTAMPKRVFGEGPMLDIFYSTMEELAPAAWELNRAFLDLWNPDALTYDWILPDNFHVHSKVMDTVTETVHIMGDPFQVSYKENMPVEQGRSLGANTIHSIDGMIVREITRRCDYDPVRIAKIQTALKQPASSFGNRAITDDDKLVLALWDHYNQSGYLSARILDHLDLQNLGHVDPAVVQEMINSLPQKPFKVLSIHDCFRCLPTYGNDLRRQYNLQLALIARSNMLSYLLSQITGYQGTIEKFDPDLHLDIIEANYALS